MWDTEALKLAFHLLNASVPGNCPGRQFSNKRQLDLLQQQKYNPKVFWKKFSQLGGSGFPSGQTVPDTVINEQGQETSNEEEVLNTWRSHFSSFLNAGTTLPVPSPSCDSDYDTSWLNDPISIEGCSSSKY